MSKDVNITNVSSGKVLQATGSCTAALGQTWKKDRDHAAQCWRLLPVRGGRFLCQIANVANGGLLGVAESATHDGNRIVLAEGGDGPGTRWRLVPLAGNEYAILNAHSGKALDLWDAATADDAVIAQFDYWHGRQQRWKITPVTRTPRRAVLTLVHNESTFLPIWLRYYSQFFDPNDIYVLDHDSTDGSTSIPGFVRTPVHRKAFDTAWQRDTVQHYQHELIDHYDVVLYTDVDEIVAPDPRQGDLGDYLHTFDQDYVTCRGYEVLHDKDREPAFHPHDSVLRQRDTWFPSEDYDKTLLARVPMLWHGGFHQRCDVASNTDPGLYLIHLHRMDYQICLARHRLRRLRPRGQHDLANDWGYQNRITDPAKFDQWFYTDGGRGRPLRPEPIPQHWRNVV